MRAVKQNMFDTDDDDVLTDSDHKALSVSLVS